MKSSPVKNVPASPASPLNSGLGKASAATVRPWLLGGLTMLCVGRPLLASEGSSWLGDDLPFNFLLLLLALGYFCLVLLRGNQAQCREGVGADLLARPLTWVDGGVALLVILCVFSAVTGALGTIFPNLKDYFGGRDTNARLSVNMACQWVGLGLIYFLTRQLVITRRETRTLVAAMFAVAVALSAIGYYQVFVGFPADRAAYAANPDAMLNELGRWSPPGSPERMLFENRLNSNEPLATFALTNSLAGYLLPWLIVGLGIAGSFWESSSQRAPGAGSSRPGGEWARHLAFVTMLVAIAGCLILTKSRSAYLALGVGLVLLPLTSASVRQRLSWRVAAGGIALLAVLIGAAVAVRGLDAEVLTEAKKSLGYRLEYWQATLEMIRKHPIVGVGPGNFGESYTKYKLPQASEEIRDPHNFLLEVWATGGTLAMLALCGVLALVFWRTWQMQDALASDGDTGDFAQSKTESHQASHATLSARAMLLAAAAGVMLPYLLGRPYELPYSTERMLAVLVMGGLTMVALWPWTSAGSLPARLPALAAGVLLVHLLAAGGIGFAGVAGSLWVLIALAVNATQPEPTTAAARVPAGKQRLLPLVGLAASLAGVMLCYFYALIPVLETRAAISYAHDPAFSLPGRIEALVDAIHADPISPEPWLEIAPLEVELWKQNPIDQFQQKRVDHALRTILVLNRNSSAAWRKTGQLYREIHELSDDKKIAAAVVECTRGAVALYPNSATLRAEFALALASAERLVPARRQAGTALELDGLTPHADKKLPAELKKRLEELLAQKEPDPPQSPRPE